MAYVVAGVFLALTGTFFVAYLAATNYADTSIRGFLEGGQYLIPLFAAFLTMRVIAEEKKLGTWELLLTAPTRDAEIVIGKFVGSLTVLTLMLGLTLYYPFLLLIFGDPDLGSVVTSYFGLFLLGSGSVAVGIFASSVSTSQVAAAVVAIGTLSALSLLGTIHIFAPGGFGEAMSNLSITHHFQDFTRGIVDTRAIVYYASLTGLFLYLAIGSVAAGRWR
jgi:ABC-2 type transport system permease protein